MPLMFRGGFVSVEANLSTILCGLRNCEASMLGGFRLEPRQLKKTAAKSVLSLYEGLSRKTSFDSFFSSGERIQKIHEGWIKLQRKDFNYSFQF